jgi:hypothetical protein
MARLIRIRFARCSCFGAVGLSHYGHAQLQVLACLDRQPIVVAHDGIDEHDPEHPKGPMGESGPIHRLAASRLLSKVPQGRADS